MKLRIGWRTVGIALALAGCSPRHERTHEPATSPTRDEGHADDASSPQDASGPRRATDYADRGVGTPPEAPPSDERRALERGVAEAPLAVMPRAPARSASPSATLDRHAPPRARDDVRRDEPPDDVGRDESPDDVSPVAAEPPTGRSDGDATEPELVERCARMRSLPSWCMERERARVRKRGAP